MTTITLHLLHHSIRTHAHMDYELIAYFVADQPLPQPGHATPPWDYTDIEQALTHYAALPITTTLVRGITVHPPTVHIRGHRALLKQRIR